MHVELSATQHLSSGSPAGSICYGAAAALTHGMSPAQTMLHAVTSQELQENIEVLC